MQTSKSKVPPSLPDDVKRLLRSGYKRSVELNSTIFGEEIRKPRKPEDDYFGTVWTGSVSGMTGFQLSVRLQSVLKELDGKEGMLLLTKTHVVLVCTWS